MPSQRAKNKVMFGGYVEKSLKAELKKLARREGMGHNVFGYAMSLVEEKLKKKPRAQGNHRGKEKVTR